MIFFVSEASSYGLNKAGSRHDNLSYGIEGGAKAYRSGVQIVTMSQRNIKSNDYVTAKIFFVTQNYREPTTTMCVCHREGQKPATMINSHAVCSKVPVYRTGTLRCSKTR